jgi:hypothetical protein
MTFFLYSTRQLIISPHSSLTSLIRSADILYFIPPYRFTTFGMGVFIGFILRSKKNVKWSRLQMAFGHASALLSLLATGVLMTINLEYDSFYQGLFTALSSVTWSWVFSWLILASHFGSNSKNFPEHQSTKLTPLFHRFPDKSSQMEIFQSDYKSLLRILYGSVHRFQLFYWSHEVIPSR